MSGETVPDRPLRILHVFRSPLGGLFRHVADLARGQAQLGHAVGLYCDAQAGSDQVEGLLAALAPDLALGIVRRPMRRAPHPADLAPLLSLRRRLRTLRPDIVHGHGAKGGLYARLGAPAGLRGPVRAYTPHGGSLHYGPGDWRHRPFMAAERLLQRRTDLLLFESDYARERYEAYLGPSRTLVRIVKNGVHPDEFSSISHNPDAADLLFVGEFRRLKGVDVLIEAAALARAALGRAPRLVLVGSGPERGAMGRRIAALGLEGTAAILPPRPMREALPLGRILVLPSRAESLPYAALEAGAAGQPLVATRVGGVPELFGPEAGRLAPPDDARALAAEIVRVMDQSDEARAREASALAAHVRANFSAEQMVRGVLAGYRAAAQARAA